LTLAELCIVAQALADSRCANNAAEKDNLTSKIRRGKSNTNSLAYYNITGTIKLAVTK
jgi:hypothetical protein